MALIMSRKFKNVFIGITGSVEAIWQNILIKKIIKLKFMAHIDQLDIRGVKKN